MEKFLLKFIDPLYGKYVYLFKKAKAFSPQTAVTKEPILPDGPTQHDINIFHKMLKAGIIKSNHPNKYWYNKKYIDNFTAERLCILIFSIILALILYWF